MKRILLMSHCLLNTASKVKSEERNLEYEYALRSRLIEACMKEDINFIQLPCPELMLFGTKRWGHVKEQFETPHYQRQARLMLEGIVDQLELYNREPEFYELLGVVAIEGSPSCGLHLTCRGNWMGEMPKRAEDYLAVKNTIYAAQEPGVFMALFAQMLQERGLNLPFFSQEEALALLQGMESGRDR